jgi:putative ubiquitin-RnfH superfamily antitoxin RatB of RatAB toxin-antitoxin module
MASTERIRVEVAYALPDEQWAQAVQLPSGSSVRQAIDQSGILSQFPGIDLAHNPVGVFGKVVGLERVLQDGERVEIYRPLSVDPKLARRQRADQARAKR